LAARCAFYVVQLDRRGGDTVTRPEPATRIEAGDGVLVVSRAEIAAVTAILHAPPERVRAGRSRFRSSVHVMRDLPSRLGNSQPHSGFDHPGAVGFALGTRAEYQAMQDRRTRRGLVWPARLLAVAALALLIGAQVYLAREADVSARTREHAVVANGLDNYADDIARKSVSVTLWDDAVAHLDNRFDHVWAEANIGRYLSDTEKFQAAFILGRDDRPLYAIRDGVTVASAGISDLNAAAADLVAQARAAERRRGSAAAIIARDHAIETPVFASGYRRVGGEAYLLTAMLVQPDFGKALPRTARSALVVTAERVDAAFLKVIVDRFLLEDARFQLGAPAAADGRVQLALGEDRAAPVASIAWTPPRPGTALLRHALPSTLLLVGALAALAWGLYVRARQAARNLIASEARAAHMAYHDTLTGLPNRASLAEKLAREHEQLRRTGVGFAVHCIDLDRFKDINDTFGHAAGDDLIRAVGKILLGACRRGDALARLGGDEFAIVQAAATPESAGALADRIVATLAEPIDLPVGRVFIGASVGVTMARDSDVTPDDHLRQADLALYRAKDGGRGRYAFFEPEMDAAVRMRRALQADLREALTNGDLQMVYQPQVDADGQAFGVEALVRWTHPNRGPVAPAVFVPLAEENGLIEALGMFTLRQAFADSALWPELKVAVNLSAAQLRLRDFTPKLLALVAETGIDPHRFELEITEGLLLGDDAQTHESLRRIRAMGFAIALDDFGTGYSSLSYLQRYPIDKIKIDRSFITNLGVDHEAEAVVSAIVKLARALGLSVIAEGVETETQRNRLTAAGCHDVQGYLFGKPCAAGDIAALLGRPAARTTTGGEAA
jgi:diguanylate cyclase (GGDEF)-like protein